MWIFKTHFSWTFHWEAKEKPWKFLCRQVTLLHFSRITFVALKVKCEGKLQREQNSLTNDHLLSIQWISHTFYLYRMINLSLNMQKTYSLSFCSTISEHNDGEDLGEVKETSTPLICWDFIELKYTCHSIYPLRVYNTVAFRFTMFCSRYCYIMSK